MIVKVHRSTLAGQIDANPSKSYTQRAYALAALSNSESIVRVPSWSDDALAALAIAERMGSEIEFESDGTVRIRPRNGTWKSLWNAGEAGLSLRMFSAIAATGNDTIVLDGEGSLKKRPVGFIGETLRLMGAKISESQTLPLTIQGPMYPGEYEIDGSFSSQLLTGILMSVVVSEGLFTLHVKDLKSSPYIEMTLAMMRQFGAQIDASPSLDRFRSTGPQRLQGCDLSIEADWSGLAFVIVASLIAGDVVINNVAPESLQADIAILEVVEMTGGTYAFKEGSLHVVQSTMNGFVFDATHCPDLFPPLAALAVHCNGESRITGVHRLRHKESDRAMTIQSEFANLGVQVNIEGDDMVILGGQTVLGGDVSAHGDHRIAMALTCLGLSAVRPVAISDAESVSKSYHNFYSDIAMLGGVTEGDKSLFVRRSSADYRRDT